MKICTGCGENKSLDQYTSDTRRPGGLRPKCRDCRRIQRRNWTQNNRPRIAAYDKQYRVEHRETQARAERRNKLQKLYGLTQIEFEAMLTAQGGACLICGDTPAHLYVDHCHSTGVVRGLLCRLCNVALGHFLDDVTRLRRAIQYLQGLQTVA